jgi:hypothetical protein
MYYRCSLGFVSLALTPVVRRVRVRARVKKRARGSRE